MDPQPPKTLSERYQRALTPVYNFDRVANAVADGHPDRAPGARDRHVFETEDLKFIIAAYDVREAPISGHNYLIHVHVSPRSQDVSAAAVQELGRTFTQIRGVAAEPLARDQQQGVLEFVFEPTEDELSTIRQWALRPDAEVQPPAQ